MVYRIQFAKKGIEGRLPFAILTHGNDWGEGPMTEFDDRPEPPLRPFIEFADPDLPEESDLIAGFKDKAGEIFWHPVPIARKRLHELFAGTPYRVSMDTDGTLQPWPDDFWDEDGFMAKLDAGILAKAQIDELVTQMLDLSKNEPDIGEDGVLVDFRVLLERLKRAAALIEDEIERRAARSLRKG